MKVLTWVLIVFGAVFLAFVVWFSAVDTVKLTAADFEVGGRYPVDERQTFWMPVKATG